MNTTVGRRTPTLWCPVLTPPHAAPSSLLLSYQRVLLHHYLTSVFYSLCVTFPYSEQACQKNNCGADCIYVSYWSLSLLFQRSFWFTCWWCSSCAVPSYLVQKKTVLWPRCRWRITKVKMMTVHFNKVETYVSGNSTGLVLILLCKASMYSSMKGHCRKSRRKEVKTTRTHMHDDSAPGEYQNDLKTTETNNSSNQPLGFITFKDSTRKLLCQTLWQTALPLKSH